MIGSCKGKTELRCAANQNKEPPLYIAPRHGRTKNTKQEPLFSFNENRGSLLISEIAAVYRFLQPWLFFLWVSEDAKLCDDAEFSTKHDLYSCSIAPIVICGLWGKFCIFRIEIVSS